MNEMTAKEILNLIDWLRAQGFDNDKVVECIAGLCDEDGIPEMR